MVQNNPLYKHPWATGWLAGSRQSTCHRPAAVQLLWCHPHPTYVYTYEHSYDFLKKSGGDMISKSLLMPQLYL